MGCRSGGGQRRNTTALRGGAVGRERSALATKYSFEVQVMIAIIRFVRSSGISVHVKNYAKTVKQGCLYVRCPRHDPAALLIASSRQLDRLISVILGR